MLHDEKLKLSQYEVDSARVKINRFGEVTLEEPLDFESKKEHIMTLKLKCGPVTSTATLLIQVLDVNDESPVFDQPSGTRFLVEENFKGPFGYVRATDPDSSFVYTLADNPYFAINPYTGLLSTRQKLNYELDRFHGLQEGFVIRNLTCRTIANYIKVIARDPAGLKGSIEIIVEVKDTNEYKPRALYKKDIIGVDILDLPVDKNTILGQVVVVDDDGNRKFSYYIEKVDPPELGYLVGIGAKTGVVYVKNDSKSTFVGTLNVIIAFFGRDQKLFRKEVTIDVLQRSLQRRIIMRSCTISQCDLNADELRTCLIFNNSYHLRYVQVESFTWLMEYRACMGIGLFSVKYFSEDD